MEFAVFSRRILTGTVSDLAPAIRIAWITVLFEAEKLRGKVKLPVRDLAKMASITTPEAAEALRVFQEPDPYSSTKEHDGRRLLPVEGEEDWYLVATWEKHAEERAQFFARLRQQRARSRHAKSRSVTDSHGESRSVTKEPELEPEPEPTRSKGETVNAGASKTVDASTPPSTTPSTPDFAAAKRVYEKLKQSALKEIPPEQVAVGLVTDFGEELILETLIDCENEYSGKPWRYFEKILTDRFNNPSKRPHNRRAKMTGERAASSAHGATDRAEAREPVTVDDVRAIEFELRTGWVSEISRDDGQAWVKHVRANFADNLSDAPTLREFASKETSHGNEGDGYVGGNGGGGSAGVGAADRCGRSSFQVRNGR